MFEPLADDQAGLFGRTAFEQGDRSGLLDPVEVGLGEDAADLAVEILKHGDKHDRGRHAVGDLDQVAHGALEPFLGVIEEAQVLDLVDAEDQARPVCDPHQLAERSDDLKRAILAGVGIERGDGFMRQGCQVAAVQILADALFDARIAALQVEQGADDVDVGRQVRVARARHDVVGHLEDQPGQSIAGEWSLTEGFEVAGGKIGAVADEGRRQAVEARDAGHVGIVGLFQAVDEPAQIIIGVVADVGRHLGVAEIGRALAMGGGAQGAHEVGLAGAGLAVEQQDARLVGGRRGAAVGGPARPGHGRQQVAELLARLGMHRRDVDGIGPPDVILPGDGVLESLREIAACHAVRRCRGCQNRPSRPW